MQPFPISLPLEMSYPTVNATLLPGSEPTLIDCGLNTAESLRVLKEGLAGQGLQLHDIPHVLVTHPHVDHVGLMAQLAEAGAEIWMLDTAAAWLGDLENNRTRLLGMMEALLAKYGFDEPTRTSIAGFFNRVSSLFPALPAGRVRTFTAGEALNVNGRDLLAISAPGHSNRQVCFYELESRTLFSADMLLPKTPIPVFEEAIGAPGVRYQGLGDMLQAFQRFSRMEIRMVYPGHGQAFSGHAALIDSQVERIHLRIEECLNRIAAGTRTLPGLVAKMYSYLPAGEQLGGLQMLLGYLDVLQDTGRIRESEENGITVFQAVQTNQP